MNSLFESIKADLEEIKNGLFEIEVTEKGVYKNSYADMVDALPISSLIEEGQFVEIIEEIQGKIMKILKLGKVQFN